MIIVLEGPDGVGKTTLADAIESVHGGDVIRMRSGPPPDDQDTAVHYATKIREMISMADSGCAVICDRLHIGELVYGPLLRGGSRITPAEANALDLMLDGAGAHLVHCTLPTGVMIERLVARDGGIDDPVSGAKLEQAPAIRVAFNHKLGKPGTMIGDWTTISTTGYPEQMAESIITAARFKSRFADRSGKWIGKRTAGTVLVSPSTVCTGVKHLAVLYSHLSDLGLARDVAVVEFDTTVDLSGRRVIALSSMAAERLDENAISYDHLIEKYPEDAHTRKGFDWNGWKAELKAILDESRTDSPGI